MFDSHPPAVPPTWRVGIDLAAVADVEESLARQGDRYLARLFTDHEVESCGGPANLRADSLAARFAAKEAVVKVLRPTAARPQWREIEVRRHESGACDIELHGSAASMAVSEGIDRMSVSLTHDAGLAAAVVVAWGSGDPEARS